MVDAEATIDQWLAVELSHGKHNQGLELWGRDVIRAIDTDNCVLLYKVFSDKNNQIADIDTQVTTLGYGQYLWTSAIHQYMGDTALHLAMRQKKLMCVHMLLLLKASTLIPNAAAETAESMALSMYGTTIRNMRFEAEKFVLDRIPFKDLKNLPDSVRYRNIEKEAWDLMWQGRILYSQTPSSFFDNDVLLKDHLFHLKKSHLSFNLAGVNVLAPDPQQQQEEDEEVPNKEEIDLEGGAALEKGSQIGMGKLDSVQQAAANTAWVKQLDEEGSIYYFNEVTRASSKEPPQEFIVAQAVMMHESRQRNLAAAAAAAAVAGNKEDEEEEGMRRDGDASSVESGGTVDSKHHKAGRDRVVKGAGTKKGAKKGKGGKQVKISEAHTGGAAGGPTHAKHKKSALGGGGSSVSSASSAESRGGRGKGRRFDTNDEESSVTSEGADSVSSSSVASSLKSSSVHRQAGGGKRDMKGLKAASTSNVLKQTNNATASTKKHATSTKETTSLRGKGPTNRKSKHKHKRDDDDDDDDDTAARQIREAAAAAAAERSERAALKLAEMRAVKGAATTAKDKDKDMEGQQQQQQQVEARGPGPLVARGTYEAAAAVAEQVMNQLTNPLPALPLLRERYAEAQVSLEGSKAEIEALKQEIHLLEIALASPTAGGLPHANNFTGAAKAEKGKDHQKEDEDNEEDNEEEEEEKDGKDGGRSSSAAAAANAAVGFDHTTLIQEERRLKQLRTECEEKQKLYSRRMKQLDAQERRIRLAPRPKGKATTTTTVGGGDGDEYAMETGSSAGSSVDSHGSGSTHSSPSRRKRTGQKASGFRASDLAMGDIWGRDKISDVVRIVERQKKKHLAHMLTKSKHLARGLTLMDSVKIDNPVDRITKQEQQFNEGIGGDAQYIPEDIYELQGLKNLKFLNMKKLINMKENAYKNNSIVSQQKKQNTQTKSSAGMPPTAAAKLASKISDNILYQQQGQEQVEQFHPFQPLEMYDDGTMPAGMHAQMQMHMAGGIEEGSLAGDPVVLENDGEGSGVGMFGSPILPSGGGGGGGGGSSISGSLGYHGANSSVDSRAMRSPASAAAGGLGGSLVRDSSSRALHAHTQRRHHDPAHPHDDQQHHLQHPNHHSSSENALVRPITVLSTQTNMKYMNVGNKGAQDLARALQGDGTIVTISLSAARISCLGAQHFARSMPDMSALRHLDLSCNAIADAGAAAVAEAIPYCHVLETCSLAGNRITVRGALLLLHAVFESTTLHWFSLQNNYVRGDDWEVLQKVMEENNYSRSDPHNGTNIFLSNGAGGGGQKGGRLQKQQLQMRGDSSTVIPFQYSDHGSTSVMHAEVAANRRFLL